MENLRNSRQNLVKIRNDSGPTHRDETDSSKKRGFNRRTIQVQESNKKVKIMPSSPYFSEKMPAFMKTQRDIQPTLEKKFPLKFQAEIKSLHSPDENLKTFDPQDQDFGFLLQIFIGPLGEEGADSFETVVCTLPWLTKELKKNLKEEGSVLIRDYFLVEKYDLSKITEKINKCIQNCQGKDWEEVCKKLGYYFECKALL